MFSVQMVKDSYDIKHNGQVRVKYPTLYEEVLRHDNESHSSWYRLSTKAFCEYQKYIEDRDIDYIG